ncbi:MAG TPA: aminotransferase class III-fold pyridoxal phosphate-dependent enzyme [Mycobacterium sp.]|nr:aminotransferase class III-fold pyridoxal phosphate-dependent enzyme [Mycobacterium sp.]
MTDQDQTSGTALWNAQAHMPSVAERQIVISRGEGSYIYTTDGRRLFDGTASLWFANIGHGRKEMAEAAYRQMLNLETYHVFGRYTTDRSVALADRLASLSPIEDCKVIFTSGGSDSIDTACKLARRHWQLRGRTSKRTILSRQFAYHGLHAYGTSITGLDFNREGYGTESLVPETARVSNADIDAVARVIDEIGAENIAALVFEPIQGTGGVNPPPPGYLEGLERICRDNDILRITDEVITGFGRTGRMFASERYGLQSDLVTFAKGVTSGYAPLGGILIAPSVWEPYFSPQSELTFRHGVTYSGHATACAVAETNLDILEKEHLLERAEKLELTLHHELDSLSDLDAVEDIRVAGFLGGVSLRADLDAPAIADDLVDRGFIVRALRGNTLQLSPPLVTTDEEVVQLAAALRESLVDADR